MFSTPSFLLNKAQVIFLWFFGAFSVARGFVLCVWTPITLIPSFMSVAKLKGLASSQMAQRHDNVWGNVF